MMRSTPQKRNQYIKENARAGEVQHIILNLFKKHGIEIFDGKIQDEILNELIWNFKSDRESAKRRAA